MIASGQAVLRLKIATGSEIRPLRQKIASFWRRMFYDDTGLMALQQDF